MYKKYFIIYKAFKFFLLKPSSGVRVESVANGMSCDGGVSSVA